jgi:S1-C subfamily serine protease
VIITAEHCAPPEGQGFRIAYRGKVYTGIVITRNANRDFAIVQAVGARIKDTVPFSDIAPIMGQKVVWIGYPLSYEMVMSTGIVGNAASNADESVEGFFVVSGQFIPGASGGPVFDERGLLLGIVSRTATFGPSLIPLGYAVPVSDILQAIKDL